MSFVVIIPARYASTRLPAKPLREICGVPMIERVWQQACKSEAARVIIATDDQRIQTAALAFGAEVCMTRADHLSGTDRLQEVTAALGLDDQQIVVNVQGDEPLIPPEVINQVAANLADNPQAGVATLCEPIENAADILNANIVKVVADKSHSALYFSRASIPWPREQFQQSQDCMPEGDIARRHIGIYAYRVSCLNHFVCWPVAPLEAWECLEQLRLLYHGVAIHVDQALVTVPAGVDTEQDLIDIENYLKTNR